MIDPEKLSTVPPSEVLAAAARGHLGLDHRFLHALLDRREESMPALLAFADGDHSTDAVDMTPELIAIFRHWKTPQSLPFFIRYIAEEPTDIPDEALEAVVELGPASVEPLLELYERLAEEQSGEVAFMLANLRVKDDRILHLLLERLDFDLSDTVLLLGLYGDERARGSLEAAAEDLGPEDAELKRDIEDALGTLGQAAEASAHDADTETKFDIWSGYPEEADLPVDVLDEDERLQLLQSAEAPAARAAAAASFFNSELTAGQQTVLLRAARSDESPAVRARSWEGLMNATENAEVLEAMLEALRNPVTEPEELAGLVVGLAPEADRNEVRSVVVKLYDSGTHRAKALESMWRSLHPSFQEYFAPHLEDDDLETRRSAVWGVGYYGVKSELERLRQLFTHEELRSDALFAYALAIPGETTRGRIQGLLARIEKDAKGLSELEEDLVKAALDERLLLAGKEPVFAEQQD